MLMPLCMQSEQNRYVVFVLVGFSPCACAGAGGGVNSTGVAPTGAMKRSTSMSYVDGCVGTWPKENR